MHFDKAHTWDGVPSACFALYVPTIWQGRGFRVQNRVDSPSVEPLGVRCTGIHCPARTLQPSTPWSWQEAPIDCTPAPRKHQSPQAPRATGPFAAPTAHLRAEVGLADFAGGAGAAAVHVGPHARAVADLELGHLTIAAQWGLAAGSGRLGHKAACLGACWLAYTWQHGGLPPPVPHLGPHRRDDAHDLVAAGELGAFCQGGCRGMGREGAATKRKSSHNLGGPRAARLGTQRPAPS